MASRTGFHCSSRSVRHTSSVREIVVDKAHERGHRRLVEAARRPERYHLHLRPQFLDVGDLLEKVGERPQGRPLPREAST